MEKINYYNLKQFAGLYLEDSYVLQIEEANEQVCFRMEFVLNEDHPKYIKPLVGEAYCYRQGVIKFIRPTKVEWNNFNLHKSAVDANGDIDLGNIDVFYKVGDTYVLEGDWGEVIISAGIIEVEIN